MVGVVVLAAQRQRPKMNTQESKCPKKRGMLKGRGCLQCGEEERMREILYSYREEERQTTRIELVARKSSSYVPRPGCERRLAQ